MERFILDFVFDETTGEVRIYVDFNDGSLSIFELNEGVRSGEIREKILEQVQRMFGDEVARDAREGKIPLVCLDDHPEDRGDKGIRQEIAEEQDVKEENLI